MSARAAEKIPSKAGWIARWAFRVGVALGLVLLALCAVYLARERILSPLIIPRAQAWVRAATGLELSVERLSGNWWNEIELVDVDLSGGTPTSELSSLKFARLRVKFELFKLLRGDFAAIRSVDLDSVQVALDLDRPLAHVERPSAFTVPVAPFPWPENLPNIVARDVQVALGLGSGRKLEAQGLELASLAATAGVKTEFDVRVRRGAFNDPQFGERAAALAARVRYRSGVLESSALECDGQTLVRELRCDLRDVNAARVSFAAVLERFGGAQEIRGAVDAGNLELALQVHELELAALLAELRISSPLSGRASLGALVRVPFARPEGWSVHTWGKCESLRYGQREADLITFAGSVDADQVELREGLVVRGANSLNLSNLSVSLAAGELDDTLRSLSGAAEIEVLDPRAILIGASDEVSSAADRVRRAQCAATFSSAGFALRSGVVETDLGGLSIQRGRAKWGPRDEPWYEGLGLDLDLQLDFEDIAPLVALFNRGEARGSLAGTVELRGPALRPSGHFLLAGNGLRLLGLELGQVSVEARADKQHVEISKLELDGGLGQASVSGNFDYNSGVISKARLSASTSELESLSDHRASAALAVVDATIDGVWNEPGVWVHARAWNLDVAGRSIEELDLESVYRDGCANVHRLVGSVDTVAVDAGGSICRDKQAGTWSVALERAQVSHEGLNLALEAPLEIAVSPDEFVVSGLCVAGSAGKAIADISWKALQQDVSIEASELYPMQLLRPFLPDGVVVEGVQGSVLLHRTPQTLALDAAFHVADLRTNAEAPPASLSFHGQLRDRELVIAQLVVSAPEHYQLNVSGRIPTDPLGGEWLCAGPLELNGEAQVTDISSLPWKSFGVLVPWTGEARTEFHLEGESSNVHGYLDANLDVTRPAANSLLDRAQLNAFQFGGRATLGDVIHVDNARFTVPGRASAILEGSLGLRVAPREWLRERALAWRNLPVALSAVVSAQDLGFVASLSKSLRRTGGSLEGELHVGGTLAKPVTTGTLELSNGEVRLSNALAPFEKLAAQVEIHGSGVRVVALRGEYGAAPFSASGTLEFSSDEPKIDVSVQGKGLLLAREAGLRLRADADFRLSGALSALKLSGDLVLVEGRFSKNIELLTLPGNSKGRRTSELALPFLRQAPWANIEFDVRVTAQKPLRIETNIAHGSVEPRLHLQGSGAAPRLSGTLLIGAGRVNLPTSALEVSSGVLTFHGESSLAPDLDIRATTRVRGYDITAQVGGTSLDPELSFTSSPPLSSEELAVLILTGQLPESALSSQGSESAMQTVAVYLGQDLMTRWLGVNLGAASEDPITERMEYYHGAEVSQSGIESTEFIFRLTPNPKGRKMLLYLRAEQDIYERINFGLKILFRLR